MHRNLNHFYLDEGRDLNMCECVCVSEYVWCAPDTHNNNNTYENKHKKHTELKINAFIY